MPRLTCNIPDAVMVELVARSEHTGETLDSITAHAQADALGLEHAALFQVSAAGALMDGVTRGTMTVAELFQHGDFGLGTFDDLDGEMVVLDGTAYQVTNRGVHAADHDAHVPYAIVTTFQPDDGVRIDGVDIGFWSPEYTTSITVAGWHLHFLDRQRRRGGHLLNCRIEGLELTIQRVAGFHMAFPETADFLRADLSEDFRDRLAAIETDPTT